MLLFLSPVLPLLIDELAVMLLLLSVTTLPGGTAVVVEVRNIILDCLALLAWSGSRPSPHPGGTFVT